MVLSVERERVLGLGERMLSLPGLESHGQMQYMEFLDQELSNYSSCCCCCSGDAKVLCHFKSDGVKFGKIVL